MFLCSCKRGLRAAKTDSARLRNALGVSPPIGTARPLAMSYCRDREHFTPKDHGQRRASAGFMTEQLLLVRYSAFPIYLKSPIATIPKSQIGPIHKNQAIKAHAIKRALREKQQNSENRGCRINVPSEINPTSNNNSFMTDAEKYRPRSGTWFGFGRNAVGGHTGGPPFNLASGD